MHACIINFQMRLLFKLLAIKGYVYFIYLCRVEVLTTYVCSHCLIKQ